MKMEAHCAANRESEDRLACERLLVKLLCLGTLKVRIVGRKRSVKLSISGWIRCKTSTASKAISSPRGSGMRLKNCLDISGMPGTPNPSQNI
jgi:hypothetical protein